MVFGLPTPGEPNWDVKLDASIEAVKTTADAAEAEIAGRLSESSLTASFVPRWRASTAYTAGDKVLNPTGQIVQARTSFTSGATYSGTNWMLAGTDQANIPVVRQADDGRSSALWEYTHNGGGGYIFHWLMGSGTTQADWAVGVGVDSGHGNGILIRNKAQGIGLKVELTATANNHPSDGTSAYGFAVEQKNATVPAVHFEQTSTGTGTLFELFCYADDPAAVMQKWVSYGGLAGVVGGQTGQLTWYKPVEVVGNTNYVNLRDFDVTAEGSRQHTRMKTTGVEFYAPSGTSNQWWPFDINASGSRLRFRAGGITGTVGDATLSNLIEFQNSKIGFFGASPVNRPSAIASPTADVASLKTAVDAIRTALTSLGLTA